MKKYVVSASSGLVLAGFVFQSALMSGLASADIAPYADYMGGLVNGCPTFGVATVEALSGVEKLYSLIHKLSSAPECQGMEPALNSLSLLNGSVKRLTARDQKRAELLELQNQIESLTLLANTVPADPSDRTPEDTVLLGEVSTSLASSRVNLAIRTASLDDEESYVSKVRKYGTLPDVQTEIMSLLRQLPEIERCTLKKPQVFAQILGTLLPAASALGSPAFGVAAAGGGQLVMSVAKYLAKRKYYKYLNQLETVQQQAAVQCALEQIQFTQCDVADALKVIEWKTQHPETRAQASTGPWAGYNILVLDMPVILEWVQKLILAQRPTRYEDSLYDEETERSISFYNISLGKIYSAIAEAREDVNDGSDQQTVGLKLLQRMIGMMVGASSVDSTPKNNVYFKVISAEEMIFYLIKVSASEFVKSGGFISDISSAPFDPSNRSLLPKNLVDVISKQFDSLVSGDGLPQGGTNQKLSNLQSRRRVPDPTLVFNYFVNFKRGKRNGVSVSTDLRVWLQSFIDSKEKWGKIYDGMPLSDVQVSVLTKSADTTLRILNKVIHYATSSDPYDDGSSNSEDELEKVGLSDEERISKLGSLLNINKSRDRFLVDRVITLVNAQLQAELETIPEKDHVSDILNSANEELFQKLSNYDDTNPELLRRSFDQSNYIRDAQVLALVGMFGEVIENQLKKLKKEAPKKPSAKSMLELGCGRILMLPDLESHPELVRYCSDVELRSVFYDRAPAEWKPKLSLKMSDYVVATEGSKKAQLLKSDGERACAYRNYFRSSGLYQRQSKARRVQP